MNKYVLVLITTLSLISCMKKKVYHVVEEVPGQVSSTDDKEYKYSSFIEKCNELITDEKLIKVRDNNFQDIPFVVLIPFYLKYVAEVEAIEDLDEAPSLIPEAELLEYITLGNAEEYCKMSAARLQYAKNEDYDIAFDYNVNNGQVNFDNIEESDDFIIAAKPVVMRIYNEDMVFNYRSVIQKLDLVMLEIGNESDLTDVLLDNISKSSLKYLSLQIDKSEDDAPTVISLPENISPNLVSLHLDGFDVSDSIEKISNLKLLKNLTVDNANLEEFPLEFGKMPKLERLSLNGNKLSTTLDINIDSMFVSLKYLDLSHNFFKSGDLGYVSRLKSLEEVKMFSNPIEEDSDTELRELITMVRPELKVWY